MECVTMGGVMEFVTIICQPRVEMLTKSDARVVVGGIQWSNLHPTKDSPGEVLHWMPPTTTLASLL